MFRRTQVYASRKGKVAPGSPEMEPELTPRALVSSSPPLPPAPRPPARPTLRTVHSFTAGRPSLRILPAGRALAQNNRNCGEISILLPVPRSPSSRPLSGNAILADHCGASRSNDAPHRCGTLLCVVEFSLLCFAPCGRAAQGWFDFCALFNLIAL